MGGKGFLTSSTAVPSTGFSTAPYSTHNSAFTLHTNPAIGVTSPQGQVTSILKSAQSSSYLTTPQSSTGFPATYSAAREGFYANYGAQRTYGDAPSYRSSGVIHSGPLAYNSFYQSVPQVTQSPLVALSNAQANPSRPHIDPSALDPHEVAYVFGPTGQLERTVMQDDDGEEIMTPLPVVPPAPIIQKVPQMLTYNPAPMAPSVDYATSSSGIQPMVYPIGGPAQIIYDIYDVEDMVPYQQEVWKPIAFYYRSCE
eukprot:Blabericola_migrator_1__4234@NODE_229_length_11083_cov_77_301198_g195_i0_p6_GENE_NODE_229_length_11083_cov_77_301198_g195_i0NODE_229_length_11083_cov_77_301198_g195_i0_p6_ORF_typecomplete_len255_score20_82_NODE_229_length_11083_cov_77_301198_g195_i070607824